MSCREVSDVTEALGDPGLGDCLHPQRGLQQMEEVLFAAVTATTGIHVGVFRATGERQWLMTPMGESWATSQADPTSQ